MQNSRNGFTLFELLVVIFFLAILSSLLLVAIQKGRETSSFLEGQNRLRQIGLSIQNYCAANNGKIPRSNVPWEIKPLLASALNDELMRWENLFRQTTSAKILPYLENENLYRAIFEDLIPPEKLVTMRAGVKIFENPLDSSQVVANSAFACNYVANAFFFSDKYYLIECQDGLSNTLFYSEHYKQCGGIYFDLFDIHNHDRYHFLRTGLTPTASTFSDSGYNILHPASFPNGDFFPNTKGTPPTSRTFVSKTFQNDPPHELCDSRLLNSSSSRGLQCLFGDGSVKTLGPNVKETGFWSLITPNGGEFSEID